MSDNPEPDAEIDIAIDNINAVIKELKKECNIVGFEPEFFKGEYSKHPPGFSRGECQITKY